MRQQHRQSRDARGSGHPVHAGNDLVGRAHVAHAHVHATGDEETSPPTAEAEPGIPFESEEERVLEEATAASDSAAGQAPAEAPAANHNEDVLTVTEKPANPRRGWWNRLIQQ